MDGPLIVFPDDGLGYEEEGSTPDFLAPKPQLPFVPPDHDGLRFVNYHSGVMAADPIDEEHTGQFRVNGGIGLKTISHPREGLYFQVYLKKDHPWGNVISFHYSRWSDTEPANACDWSNPNFTPITLPPATSVDYSLPSLILNFATYDKTLKAWTNAAPFGTTTPVSPTNGVTHFRVPLAVDHVDGYYFIRVRNNRNSQGLQFSQIIRGVGFPMLSTDKFSELDFIDDLNMSGVTRFEDGTADTRTFATNSFPAFEKLFRFAPTDVISSVFYNELIEQIATDCFIAVGIAGDCQMRTVGSGNVINPDSKGTNVQTGIMGQRFLWRDAFDDKLRASNTDSPRTGLYTTLCAKFNRDVSWGTEPTTIAHSNAPFV